MALSTENIIHYNGYKILAGQVDNGFKARIDKAGGEPMMCEGRHIPHYLTDKYEFEDDCLEQAKLVIDSGALA